MHVTAALVEDVITIEVSDTGNYHHRDQLDHVLSENNEGVHLDPVHSRAFLQLAATHENAGRYQAAIARWSL